MADPLRLWADSLAAWAIPDKILASAPESPWVLPVGLFARRADISLERRAGPSQRLAAEALPAGGSVLDVGAGAGASSLPLAARAGSLIAVDQNPAMLAEVRRRAERAGLPVTLVEGDWPGVAPRTPAADVVICGHVLYNVAELGPFALALTEHARHRVVVELTAHHPTAGLNPLWVRFHGLVRPERPTWEDAVACLSSLGLAVRVKRHQRLKDAAPAQTLDEMVALTRRRLCLPASRDSEVLEALVELGVDPSRPASWSLADASLVSLWWKP